MLILLSGWQGRDAYSLSWSGKSAGTGICLVTATRLLFYWQCNSYSLFWSASESIDNGRLLNDGKSRQWRLLDNRNVTLILLADPVNWWAWATAQQQQGDAYSLGWFSGNATLIFLASRPANQWTKADCLMTARGDNGNCSTTATQRLFSGLIRKIGRRGRLLNDSVATLINDNASLFFGWLVW